MVKRGFLPTTLALFLSLSLGLFVVSATFGEAKEESCAFTLRTLETAEFASGLEELEMRLTEDWSAAGLGEGAETVLGITDTVATVQTLLRGGTVFLGSVGFETKAGLEEWTTLDWKNPGSIRHFVLAVAGNSPRTPLVIQAIPRQSENKFDVLVHPAQSPPPGLPVPDAAQTLNLVSRHDQVRTVEIHGQTRQEFPANDFSLLEPAERIEIARRLNRLSGDRGVWVRFVLIAVEMGRPALKVIAMPVLAVDPSTPDVAQVESGLEETPAILRKAREVIQKQGVLWLFGRFLETSVDDGTRARWAQQGIHFGDNRAGYRQLLGVNMPVAGLGTPHERPGHFIRIERLGYVPEAIADRQDQTGERDKLLITYAPGTKVVHRAEKRTREVPSKAFWGLAGRLGRKQQEPYETQVQERVVDTSRLASMGDVARPYEALTGRLDSSIASQNAVSIQYIGWTAGPRGQYYFMVVLPEEDMGAELAEWLRTHPEQAPVLIEQFYPDFSDLRIAPPQNVVDVYRHTSDEALRWYQQHHTWDDPFNVFLETVSSNDGDFRDERGVIARQAMEQLFHKESVPIASEPTGTGLEESALQGFLVPAAVGPMVSKIIPVPQRGILYGIELGHEIREAALFPTAAPDEAIYSPTRGTLISLDAHTLKRNREGPKVAQALVSADGENLYAVEGSTGVMLRLDPNTLQMAARGEHPAEMAALSPDGNSLIIVDKQTGQLVRLDLEDHLREVARSEAAVVLDPDAFLVTDEGVYAFDRQRGRLLRFDLNNLSVAARFGGNLIEFAVDQECNALFAIEANGWERQIVRFDTEGGAETARTPEGTRYGTPVLGADPDALYATDIDRNVVVRFDAVALTREAAGLPEELMDEYYPSTVPGVLFGIKHSAAEGEGVPLLADSQGLRVQGWGPTISLQWLRKPVAYDNYFYAANPNWDLMRLKLLPFEEVLDFFVERSDSLGLNFLAPLLERDLRQAASDEASFQGRYGVSSETALGELQRLVSAQFEEGDFLEIERQAAARDILLRLSDTAGLEEDWFEVHQYRDGDKTALLEAFEKLKDAAVTLDQEEIGLIKRLREVAGEAAKRVKRKQDQEWPVGYVPSPLQDTARVFRFAELQPGDEVLDLGGADGRVAFLAASDLFRAHAVSPEINEYLLDKARAGEKALVDARLIPQGSVKLMRKNFMFPRWSGFKLIHYFSFGSDIPAAEISGKVLEELVVGGKFVVRGSRAEDLHAGKTLYEDFRRLMRSEDFEFARLPQYRSWVFTRVSDSEKRAAGQEEGVEQLVVIVHASKAAGFDRIAKITRQVRPDIEVTLLEVLNDGSYRFDDQPMDYDTLVDEVDMRPKTAGVMLGWDSLASDFALQPDTGVANLQIIFAIGPNADLHRSRKVELYPVIHASLATKDHTIRKKLERFLGVGLEEEQADPNRVREVIRRLGEMSGKISVAKIWEQTEPEEFKLTQVRFAGFFKLWTIHVTEGLAVSRKPSGSYSMDPSGQRFVTVEEVPADTLQTFVGDETLVYRESASSLDEPSEESSLPLLKQAEMAFFRRLLQRQLLDAVTRPGRDRQARQTLEALTGLKMEAVGKLLIAEEGVFPSESTDSGLEETTVREVTPMEFTRLSGQPTPPDTRAVLVFSGLEEQTRVQLFAQAPLFAPFAQWAQDHLAELPEGLSLFVLPLPDNPSQLQAPGLVLKDALLNLPFPADRSTLPILERYRSDPLPALAPVLYYAFTGKTGQIKALIGMTSWIDANGKRIFAFFV